MSTRDSQKKFNQQSNISASEFDRQNTNATKYTNPARAGENFEDTKASKDTYLTILLLQIFSLFLGVLFFLYIVPLARFFVSYKFYISLNFLVVSLLVTGLVAYLIYFVAKKIAKIK